jgi:hypothetical protein
MRHGGKGWLNRRKGMALIMVVMVLTSMLLLGTAFMSNIRLDVTAARNYNLSGECETYALEGTHRAMSELMYDVWGVNEGVWIAGAQRGKAFVCAPEWGQLSSGFSVEGTPMIAAYTIDGNPATQIVSHSSVYRRTVNQTGDITTPWVQTDLRWMYKPSFGLGGQDPDLTDVGVPYGGYYLDEFLPAHTDNGDVFEMALHYNHGAATGRDFLDDEKEGPAGWWSGDYWPNRGGGEKAPWDYVDTRISPSSFFHIFRFDLVDKNDRWVHCTGYEPQNAPLPPKIIDKSDPAFKATHLDYAVVPTWPKGDEWGGALNINQVNNNYRWEVYYNYKSYAGVPVWSEHHYNESKWIYIYDAAGLTRLGRYAVLVEPDSGRPNANYLYDGPNWGQSYGTSLDDPSISAAYLLAIDKGFDPHGSSDWTANPDFVDATHANTIKAKTPKYTYANCDNWGKNICSRVNAHIASNGMITNRSELAMLLRKDSFDDPGLSDTELSSDARVITSLTTSAGYEYLLDRHWEKDRLIIDSAKPGTVNGANSLYNSPDTRTVAAGLPVAGNKGYLQNLAFYWGPDQRVAHGSSPMFNWETEIPYHYTPFHEPVVDPVSPEPVIPFPGIVTPDKLQKRGHRAKLALLSWLMGAQGVFHDFFNVRDMDGDGNVFCFWNGSAFQYVKGASYAAYRDLFLLGDAAIQLPPMHRIIQVGRVTPDHPTQAENANYMDDNYPCAGGPPGFDVSPMNAEYYYVMLVQSGGYSSSDTRVPLPDCYNNWKQAKLYIDNTEILSNPPAINKSDIFVLSVTNDMDDALPASPWHTGDDLNKPHDNSGSNEQTLNEDIWAWKGGDGGIFKRHTCWLSAWEDPAVAGISQEPSPVDQEIKFYYHPGPIWGPVFACTHIYTTRGNSAVNAKRDISAKKSHTADHPARYITIFWKASCGIDGDKITYAGTNNNILDTVYLPKNIGSLAPNKAFAAVDFFNNASPSCWQTVDSHVPWRNYFFKWNDDVEGHDYDWASNWCNEHWAGGRAPNYIYNSWPEYRRDYYNDNRANGWNASAHACHSEINNNYNMSFDSWPDLRRCPTAFAPPIEGANNGGFGFIDDFKPLIPTAFQSTTPVQTLLKGTVSSSPIASYNPYNPYYITTINGYNMNDLVVRTNLLHYVYDPDLRIWMDLARVAPLNELFTPGYLTEVGTQLLANSVPPVNKIFSYPIYDKYDNNQDGVIDIPTGDELDPNNTMDGGYYVSDRKSVARVNINLLNHPAGVWYIGVGGPYTGTDQHHMVIIGRRPLYGYTSLYDWINFTQYGSVWGGTNTPYNKIVWDSNRYADATSCSMPYDVAQDHIDQALGWGGTISYAAQSPVYTIYVTAQSVKDNTSLSEPNKPPIIPLNEIRIRATVERTWDGKMNFLEFTWMPQDVATQ